VIGSAEMLQLARLRHSRKGEVDPEQPLKFLECGRLKFESGRWMATVMLSS
jgi:hypothetical protein